MTPKNDRQQLTSSLSFQDPIRNGQWLDDRHIDRAQKILHKQFPNIDGFQSVLLFSSQKQRQITVPNNHFIQILNVSGNHWVTVSNIGCKDAEINFYDSIYRKPSVPCECLQQITSIFNFSMPNIKLHFPDIKKQTGTDDCGLFAIAVAVALCSNLVPETCDWNQSEMRHHLITCFDQDNFTLFPSLPRCRSYAPPGNVSFDIVCL